MNTAAMMERLKQHLLNSEHHELDTCRCCQTTFEILTADEDWDLIVERETIALRDVSEQCLQRTLGLLNDPSTMEKVVSITLEDFEFGKYRLGSRLGKGGCGEVYEATDSELNCIRAVKILPSSTDLREAMRLAELKSDHIVTVFDAGKTEDFSYLVMERLSCSLADELNSEHVACLPIASLYDAVRRVLDVCKGVDDLHRLGIVHRDVKPANILRDVNRNCYKLADLGISSSVNAQGDFKHTPRYASERQRSGSPVDPSDDVYSIGIVLKELCENLGVNFSAASSKKRSSLLREFISRRQEIRDVVSRCLESSPSIASTEPEGPVVKPQSRRQYHNGGDVLADLTLFLNHKPVPSDSLWTNFTRWLYLSIRYSPLFKFKVSLAFLAALAFGLLLAYANSLQNHWRDYITFIQQQSASDHNQAYELLNHPDASSRVRKLLDRAIEGWDRIGNQKNFVVEKSRSYHYRGIVNLRDHDFERAEYDFRMAIELLKDYNDENDLRQDAELFLMLSIDKQPNRREEVRSDLGLVLAKRGEALLESNDLDNPGNLPYLDAFATQQSDAVARLVEEFQRQPNVNLRTQLATVRDNLAKTYEVLGRYQEAITEFEALESLRPNDKTISLRKAYNITFTKNYNSAIEIADRLSKDLRILEGDQLYNLACTYGRVATRLKSDLASDASVTSAISGALAALNSIEKSNTPKEFYLLMKLKLVEGEEDLEALSENADFRQWKSRVNEWY